ncbi:MAG: hypothetical protein QM651_17885 [Rhodoblastus sp.]
MSETTETPAADAPVAEPSAPFTAPVFANAAGTQIDITTPRGVRTTLTADDPETAEIFAKAMAGDYGPIAAYVAPAPDPLQARRAIEMACAMRIVAALQGKDGSMQREAAYLLQLAVLGQTLTDEQKAEVTMFNAVNAWETAMIEARDALIGAGDAASAALDASWPAPPSGLAEFLVEF